MASEPLLDFAALLEPIPGENPAGDSIPFAIREQFEEARKEVNPDDYPPDDPMRGELQKKDADWRGIIRTAKEVLTTTSKDLLVVARLTEALVKEHGFAGLRDGLRLFRELIENAWDRVNPPIEDGDLEVRAGPFHWLDDADRGARFPTALRRAPLVISDKGKYGWTDWRQSQDGKGRVSRDDFEKAMLAMSLEECQRVADDIDQSIQELNQLTALLNQKMGAGVAPGLTSVRQVVGECRTLVQQILQQKRPSADGAVEEGGSEAAGGGRSRAVGSRAEAYRQLANAAAVLRQLEPHSPIPYLVERAVELGNLPFPQLIRALIRDANVLAELSREFGLHESQEAPPAAP